MSEPNTIALDLHELADSCPTDGCLTDGCLANKCESNNITVDVSFDDEIKIEESDSSISNTFVLPEGWQTISKKRRKGVTKGRIDRYWIAPNGTKFNSMKGVRIALKKVKPS